MNDSRPSSTSRSVQPFVALFTGLLVLGVACANVAGLVLTRHVSRRRELAIRLSLGASRSRVFFELLAETVWLSCGGVIVGVLVAFGGLVALNQLMPSSVAIAGSAGSFAVPTFEADVWVFGFAALTGMATVVVCGAVPAWRTTRNEASAHADAPRRGTTAGPVEHRLRNGLVSIEIALATTVLVVALLLVQSVVRLTAVDPGFRGDDVVAMTIGRVDDLSSQRTGAVCSDVLRRVSEVAGARHAALNDYVLLSNEDDYEGVENRRATAMPSGQWPREEWRRVSSDYFRTLRIPVIRGRDFTLRDTADSPSVVVINEAMARKYWPGVDPVGRRLRLTAAPYGWSEVIGIVGDVREVGVDQPAKPMMFVPYHRGARPVMALFVRVDSTSDAMIQIDTEGGLVGRLDAAGVRCAACRSVGQRLAGNPPTRRARRRHRGLAGVGLDRAGHLLHGELRGVATATRDRCAAGHRCATSRYRVVRHPASRRTRIGRATRGSRWRLRGSHAHTP